MQMHEVMFAAWLGAWAVVAASAAVLWLRPSPKPHVRLHVRLLWLPVAAACAGVMAGRSGVLVGPWRADALGWLMALYVAALGGVIQHFSVRYLHGDRAYPRYFSLLTWTTGAAALTWMSDDLRLLALCWALMSLGLVGLVALKREWAPARAVAVSMAKRFSLGVLAVAAAAVWLGMAGGSWRLPAALAHARALPGWEREALCGLLLVAALIQAGQWPFQRWLLESAVTPTPVSAVMHAGLVNAGGLLLARMSPLFNVGGTLPHMALLLLAWLSVLIGTGISLVHVDYKRQLVASTMAQMGLMLVQCALSAYGAAVVHLVFHGLFKATLFLRSGSVVPRPQRQWGLAAAPSARWFAVAAAMGAATAVLYWAVTPQEPARWLSAMFLGAGAALAWRYLSALKEGRWLGFAVLAALAALAELARTGLAGLVRAALAPAQAPPVVPAVAAGLLAAGAVTLWALAVSPTSQAFVRLYLWLIHLGEPRRAAIEPHPRYLAAYAEEAGLG
ncbi:putative NADH-quinone oxidoreductase subunit 5 [Alicyclobacillus cellulosilyticus]|uniref:Probable inorganic carbon transporter subunit DabB n=1 Tax=Alicyclobacillus cellulosilyticus TaxID=1003997 RepID=A0A917K4F7_9BACL|nr:NADH dehydrogenase subunit 5 [Alicyclobacillus cellulosilyticus]GGJ00673.1 putative NADH-quinone oxidoreductase subunit 5 [Alicyclobacillus cellulosilyticus]